MDRAPDALALTRSRWAALIDENLPPRELWSELVFRLPELQYPDTLNLAERLLIGIGGRAPDDDATSIIYRGDAIAYGVLRRRVFACAAGLIRLGVQPADRVALFLHNCPEFIVSWLAVQWIGAIGVPVPPVYRLREIAHIIVHSSARVVICSAELVAAVESARHRLAHEFVTLVVPFDGPGDVSPPLAHPTGRGHPVLITYIASATGALKGVVHSPEEILATADTYARDVLDLSSDDICIGSSSLAWSFGLGASLVFPLHAGATTVLVDGAGASLPAAIVASRATVLFSVPTVYRLLLRRPDLGSFDLTSLRRCVSAAEPLPAAVVEAWRTRTGLEILDGLGTTELAHIFISARSGAVRPGSIGTPVAGYEARIVDDEFCELSRGVAGMLAVCGPTGGRYWRDAEAQRRVHRDRWTLTGDVCIQDEDGWFRHVRRIDDLIVCGGHKISPLEVERALLDHPAVSLAKVLAVADPIRGSVSRAVVSLRPGFEISGAEDRLKQFLRQELAPYKCPREIVIREFPTPRRLLSPPARCSPTGR